MGTVRYTVFDGEILSETRDGVKRDYVPDPLGSTIALLDSSQTKTDTFDYWPYGKVRARTGSTDTPFQFVGTLGYYKDVADHSYIRERVLDSTIGRFLSPDPLESDKPAIAPYVYTGGSPIARIDPSGLQIVGPPYPGPPVTNDCKNAKGEPGRVKCPPAVIAAKRKICAALLPPAGGYRPIVGTGCVTGPRQASCLVRWCWASNVYCISDSSRSCRGGWACGYSCTSPGSQHYDWAVFVCLPVALGSICAGTTCSSGMVQTILHEMMGVCGSGHEVPAGPPGSPPMDVCENRAACLCRALGI